MEPVTQPVEFILERDHPGLDSLGLCAVGREAVGRRGFPLYDLGGAQGDEGLGQRVQSSSRASVSVSVRESEMGKASTPAPMCS